MLILLHICTLTHLHIIIYGISINQENRQGVERLPCHYSRADTLFVGLGDVPSSLSDNYGRSDRYFSYYLLCHGGRNSGLLFFYQCHFPWLCLEDIRTEIQREDYLCYLYVDFSVMVFPMDTER